MKSEPPLVEDHAVARIEHLLPARPFRRPPRGSGVPSATACPAGHVGLVGGLAVEEAIPAERLALRELLRGFPAGSENLAAPGFLFHTAATRSCSLEFRASSSGVGCACGMSGRVTSSVPYGELSDDDPRALLLLPVRPRDRHRGRLAEHVDRVVARVVHRLQERPAIEHVFVAGGPSARACPARPRPSASPRGAAVSRPMRGLGGKRRGERRERGREQARASPRRTRARRKPAGRRPPRCACALNGLSGRRGRFGMPRAPELQESCPGRALEAIALARAAGPSAPGPRGSLAARASGRALPRRRGLAVARPRPVSGPAR